jgi:hypothetical protein
MRLLWIAVVASCTACAGNLRPATSSRPNEEALLILPGFGYRRAGARALESLAPTIHREGIDLYVADYLTRGGLAASRTKLERFIRDNRLERYRRVHVFAFIAGAWTVNPLIEKGKLPNLGRVVYDRSPFQERAPAIAVDQLRMLAWLCYGSTIFDLSRTPYAYRSAPPGVDVALVVESVPTTFIKRHEKAARALGHVAFECGAFNQRYDDLRIRRAQPRRAVRTVRRALAGTAFIHSHRPLQRGDQSHAASQQPARFDQTQVQPMTMQTACDGAERSACRVAN